MEVFVRNLPEQTTENQAQRYFQPILAKLNINVFHCEKHNGKNFARITVPDRQQGAIFLQHHGQTKPGREGFAQVRNKLYFRSRPINCSESTHAPDEFLLQSLQKDGLASIRAKEPREIKSKITRSKLQRVFDIIGIECGLMDYRNVELGFVMHFQQARSGRLKFTRQCILISLDQKNQDVLAQQIKIPYSSVQSFITGSLSNPFLLFSLFEAPKFFEKSEPEFEKTEPVTDLILKLSQMGPNMSTVKKKNHVRYRITALAKGHEAIVATCLCYRIKINLADIQNVQALKMVPGLPKSIPWDMPNITELPFNVQMTELNRALTDARTKLSFEVKFQFQRLALNSYLPLYKALQLIKLVQQSSATVDTSTLADAIRRLSSQLPFAGADADAADLSVEAIYKLLQQNERSIAQERHFSKDFVAEHDHIAYIHKATVTPVGTYLEGPMPEVKNRVLRKYSSFTSYFLQVSFVDEDGETLRYDRSTSLERIFHGRFKKVLEGIITIAGRPYEFLGFSHSSLRAQTCWFMAPFIFNGHLLYARMVIKDLGDFSAIRSPAKCAARIGQAFSQTFSSVALSRSAIREIPDVKRNNRVFSDGVGTCSKAVLQKIWAAYAHSRVYKPTVCQVRYAGAKGMISLDSRLHGEALCLRRSMIKFEAPNSIDIEICGAGFKPLPLYLNRPLIKILEDLGVPDWSFVYLQAEAVEQLRITTLNPVNAANFLQRNLIGKAARLSWLIRKLSYIGMSFQDDHFLRSVLELAVLIQLKELKYRSRIYVENGMTVYGIMDETDFLEEGQIYCSVQNDKSGMVLTGRVVITRNPALHPGDVQCVDAVDAPKGSPLRDVHNCVVFSSKGKRDLPSQLSGGDLDGDLYNIIYDNDLFPQRTCEPADYAIAPPLDIGREVTRSDMTAFFILFMENDQLGRISTLHQTLADQKADGTFDPQCILLAQLASTAVDFSKTGIPADLSMMQKYSRVRPDFQATGPRVLVEHLISLEKQEAAGELNDGTDNEDEEEIQQTTRYYTSRKVLGKLYRAIDEHEFLKDIQRQSKLNSGGIHNLADQVWRYVQKETALVQYRHWLQFAKEVKEAYEDSMTDTMLQFSAHPSHFVSEVEVFCGSIIGKNGSQSKRQREFSVSMKEKHDRDVSYTIMSILRGEENDEDMNEEALARSIACLDVARNYASVRKKVGKLVSFTWVAAAVCLREVEKFVGA